MNRVICNHVRPGQRSFVSSKSLFYRYLIPVSTREFSSYHFQTQFRNFEMDKNFFTSLQSIAAVSKRENLRTQSYDVGTLELKFPRNIISVAPPTAKAAPLLPGETIVSKLSIAVYTAFMRALNGGPNGRVGCSILVHEGVYVNALGWKMPRLPEGFSLEIVGLNGVHLVLEDGRQFAVFVNMTLKNCFIFDRRRDRQLAAISITDGALVDFIRVKIHSPRALAIHLAKSTLSLVGSAIVDCGSAVLSFESVLRVTDTVICTTTDFESLLLLKKTKFEAKNSSFKTSGRICIFFSKSRGIMEYCNFIGPSELPCTYTDRDDCLRLCAGSKVVLLSSNFSNFVSVAISRGYDCKIVVDSCVISNCLRAFGFIFNSHGLVKNCLLSSGAVALVANNVKGEILFRNNRLTFDPTLSNHLEKDIDY